MGTPIHIAEWVPRPYGAGLDRGCTAAEWVHRTRPQSAYTAAVTHVDSHVVYWPCDNGEIKALYRQVTFIYDSMSGGVGVVRSGWGGEECLR